jgi:hypothetical protein
MAKHVSAEPAPQQRPAVDAGSGGPSSELEAISQRRFRTGALSLAAAAAAGSACLARWLGDLI